MRSYSSTVRVTWGNGPLEAKNKRDYIEKIKEQFLEEYGINLIDDEIQDIREEKEDG